MDDEELVRSVTRSMLEFKGYEADLASDGAEAIKKYTLAMQNENPFDVNLLHFPGFHVFPSAQIHCIIK